MLLRALFMQEQIFLLNVAVISRTEKAISEPRKQAS